MGLTAAVDFQFQMVTLRCHKCGVPYGIPDYFQERRREDHEAFYCINGHGACYSAANETEKLRSELEKANRAKQMALDSARMEAEQRKKAERKLDRINKGVCTKCNRTFTNIARHMQSKHGVECNKPPKGSKTR